MADLPLTLQARLLQTLEEREVLRVGAQQPIPHDVRLVTATSVDLLLYLIRKQNIDILDIPVAEITRQYMGYVELMKAVRLELA
ncbi:sigma 54-interacting transcriptional regulator, partial [Pseudomonas aeruginosa]|nr:sigma 54-interacting transcriptional regulator [Pseudomonas aeruginosa]